MVSPRSSSGGLSQKTAEETWGLRFPAEGSHRIPPGYDISPISPQGWEKINCKSLLAEPRGTFGLTPRPAQLAHGFPHWFAKS